jgi:hypothetical protein
MEDTYLEGKQVPEYAYKIEGTAITGCVFMDVEDRNFEYPETIGEGSQVGAAKPEDNIPSQPSNDIITIPEDAKDDGSVIEDHIKHETNASLVRLADQGFRILHGSEHGIDGIIIRHIIAVVIHRRFEKRRDPDIVDSQGLQIVQTGTDSVQIADSVAVRITV